MTPRSSRSMRTAAIVVAVAVVSVTACSTKTSTSRDTATSTSSTGAAATTHRSGTAATAEGAPFDPTVVHDLSVTTDADAFDEMISTYESSNEKTWIEATVTIDGATYKRAGLRLKGNSSLRGVSNAAAEDLPYRIRLDKFVDGQNHEGFTDIVVRSNSSASSLNEAVALDLLAKAGLASQAAASTRFTVNGSDATLRLIVELPEDDAWQDEHFDTDGALFKAESTGDWSYRGDDPDSYIDVFDQESGKKKTDITPLIDLLRFVDESDDATFEAELSKHLDVDSFATYLAMMDLVGNFDDISGPGNNAYVWWDADSGVFTVVPWDLNLAFGASPSGGGTGDGPGGGPDGGMGGGTGGGMDRPPGFGGDATGNADRPTRPLQGDAADGDAVNPGAGGATDPADGDAVNPGGGRDGGPGGGRFGRSNPLVERFHATASFEKLYTQRLGELRTKLFESGTAQELLDARVDVLTEQAADLIDPDTVRTEADKIAVAFD